MFTQKWVDFIFSGKLLPKNAIKSNYLGGLDRNYNLKCKMSVEPGKKSGKKTCTPGIVPGKETCTIRGIFTSDPSPECLVTYLHIQYQLWQMLQNLTSSSLFLTKIIKLFGNFCSSI